MSSPFLGLGIAQNALRAFQRALDTTGHNIANVDTAGYSRQTVGFTNMDPLAYFQNGWKFQGQGVFTGSVTRIRDQFLDANYQAANSDLSKFKAASDGLKSIDGIFNEPSEDGVANGITKLFDAFSALAANPSDAATRSQVRLAGQNLADRVRGRYGALLGQQGSQQAGIKTTINQIDTLAGQISALNKEISKYNSASGPPNDILDARDRAVDALAQLVDIKKYTQPDGTYTVYAAGSLLVDSGGARAFPASYDPATGTVSDGTYNYPVRSGRLAGQFTALSGTQTAMADLDTLANQLRTQFNAVHQTGVNALGNTGVRFFNDSTTGVQTGAIDFDLSAEVKGSPLAIAAGVSGAAGDGGLAQSLSDMRDTTFTGLGNQTFSVYFQGVVNKSATNAQFYAGKSDTQAAVVQQIDAQRQAVSGVSMDEELANMQKFQRSYQAAAKALTIFDQVTQDTLDMIRR
ncbi:MAG: flagellar hook-associated protein FlgK [Fimbriimonadaceae bacterium]|nr:flagellar hook-associated protein FlgK [Fimbriimonadaceae bacterium]